MMEFKALNVPNLTEEVATKLKTLLNKLPGLKSLNIVLETRELHIIFDESQLDFRTLAQEMTKAGCPLTAINAALLSRVI